MAVAPDPLASVGDLPTSGPAYLQSVGDLATRMGEPLPDAPTRAATTASPPPGYVVEKELGRGAFGVVYLARHKDDPDTPVALKVVRAAGTLDRLLLEPALLARLDHPNVVRVLDYFPHPDGRHLVIALEYVGGGDLKAAVDECDRFPPAVVREVLVQLGGALAEAHAKGVVHRDLKPANVLLDRAGPAVRYVLTDFGVGGEDGGLRAAKTVAGTYLFMAPEQLRGRPGPQSDLWALGVVAYRMLTGGYPFPGPSAADLARQIQLTTPAPPSAVLGEPVDPDLERAVLRLLDRSETERIGSAAELLRALGAGEARTGLFGRVRPRTDSRLGERVRSLGDTLDRDYERSRRRMRVWAGLYLVSASVIGGAVGVWAAVLFYRAHADPDRRPRRRRLGWAFALAFAALPLSWAETLARQVAFRPLASQGGAAGQTFVGLFTAFSSVGQFALPVLAANAFARGNRLRRERVLLRAAAGGAGDDYLRLLRQELDNRTEDVGFHLKYAEALAARGDDRAAAVEARLLLVQDPYHFAGNLLLAQCYLRLGLPADGRRVCDDYLAVAGYCFEFAELRDQCGKAGAA